MKIKYIIILSLIVTFIIVCSVTMHRVVNSNTLINENNKEFHNNIIELSSLNESKKIYLNELASFEWDKVYFFDPYQSKREIFKTLGFKWYGLKQQTSESGMQIIFVNNNNVVCYCNGYGERNGYFIDGNILTNKRVLKKSDEVIFLYNYELTKKLGYVYIEWYAENKVK